MISIHLFGQDSKAIELQSHWNNEAKKNLNRNNLLGGFTSYHFADEMIPNSELGKESLKFSDSIKTILRNTLKNNLEGIWEIKVFGRIKS